MMDMDKELLSKWTTGVIKNHVLARKRSDEVNVGSLQLLKDATVYFITCAIAAMCLTWLWSYYVFLMHSEKGASTDVDILPSQTTVEISYVDPPLPVDSVPIFIGGEGGYPWFFGPGLVRVPGTGINGKPAELLAWAEAHRIDCNILGKPGLGDRGWIDIVQKRSVDGGRTWSNLEVVLARSEFDKTYNANTSWGTWVGNLSPILADKRLVNVNQGEKDQGIQSNYELLMPSCVNNTDVMLQRAPIPGQTQKRTQWSS